MLLDNFSIFGLPPTALYIPNFISKEEESEILRKVYSVPKPKWTQLLHRRLQNWGGIPHIKGMIPETIPDWLQKYLDKVNTLKVFPQSSLPNHVLINEYLPGQGIMPHTDGPLFYPIVTTISCGSHIVLNFQPFCNKELGNRHQEATKNFTLLLEPRSLLILKHDIYEKYMHGIDNIEEDVISNDIYNLSQCVDTYTEGPMKRSTRISLTIRNVPKTSQVKLKF